MENTTEALSSQLVGSISNIQSKEERMAKVGMAMKLSHEMSVYSL